MDTRWRNAGMEEDWSIPTHDEYEARLTTWADIILVGEVGRNPNRGQIYQHNSWRILRREQTLPTTHVNWYIYGYEGFASDEHTLRQRGHELLCCINGMRILGEERNRPIIFMADSSGYPVVRKAIEISRAHSSHSAYHHVASHDCIHGIIPVGTEDSKSCGLKDDRKKRRLPLFNSGSDSLFVSRPPETAQLHIHRRSRRRVATHILLATTQVACVTVMGHYRNSRADFKLSEWKPEAGQPECNIIKKHISHVDSPCDTRVSRWLDPSANLFIFAIMAYIISYIMYYNHNRKHKYQSHALASGLLFGAMLSIYQWKQNIASNPVLTFIPTSMTFSLLLSTLIHSIWQALFPSEVEKAYRQLKTWASDGGSLQEMLRGESGSLRSEKDVGGLLFD